MGGPYREEQMAGLGVNNTGWGICGFTSSFYAMYSKSPPSRGKIINATDPYRVLAEIKTYLKFLEADNSPLLTDITDFTQSFGPPYDTFTIADYVDRINQAAAQNKRAEDIVKDPLFGIAMPPKAVADYLVRAWERSPTIFEGSGKANVKECILGVSPDGGKGGGPYKGLKHYLYRRNGVIYSWGRTFSSVQKAMSSWSKVHIVYVITA